MQSKRDTIIEVSSNTAIGLVGSWIITYLTMLFSPSIAVGTTLAVFLCTIWSLVRGYFVRRYFNQMPSSDEKVDSKPS